MNDLPGRASTYLDHLPAVFREEVDGSPPGFLGRFLLAFEHVLTGVGDPAEPGLDELLDRVPGHLDPARAPAAFLDWLAGWVGLTLRADLETGAPGEEAGDAAAAARRERARALVAGAVPLYRLRGTRRGLEELVRVLTGGLSPTIDEMAAAFQVGVSSTVGRDTLLGGGASHFFHVLLRLPQPGPAARRRVEALVRAILDVEKPAHTRYRLDVLSPAMQVGVHSRIGVDTLLVPAGNPGES
ncbi:MAG TPA: phage tail protein [Longimicrobium sp.]|nr:phage tail protein [Longimicrobium sp.]